MEIEMEIEIEIEIEIDILFDEVGRQLSPVHYQIVLKVRSQGKVLRQD